MSIIFDSTPLIYLCKVGLDWIFKELGTECIIPDSVYDEVIRKGMQRGDADALIADKLVKNGVIQVQHAANIDNLAALNMELHQGEIEVLCLAETMNGIAIVDDDVARTAGGILEIEVHGTIYLIFLMVKRGKLPKDDAKAKLNEIIMDGFWMGHKQYLTILELLDEIDVDAPL